MQEVTFVEVRIVNTGLVYNGDVLMEGMQALLPSTIYKTPKQQYETKGVVHYVDLGGPMDNPMHHQILKNPTPDLFAARQDTVIEPTFSQEGQEMTGVADRDAATQSAIQNLLSEDSVEEEDEEEEEEDEVEAPPRRRRRRQE